MCSHLTKRSVIQVARPVGEHIHLEIYVWLRKVANHSWEKNGGRKMPAGKTIYGPLSDGKDITII